MDVILHKKILRQIGFVLFIVKIMRFVNGKRDTVEVFTVHLYVHAFVAASGFKRLDSVFIFSYNYSRGWTLVCAAP